jgi:hypothetical protein
MCADDHNPYMLVCKITFPNNKISIFHKIIYMQIEMKKEDAYNHNVFGICMLIKLYANY